jgi:hypothetical protein
MKISASDSIKVVVSKDIYYRFTMWWDEPPFYYSHNTGEQNTLSFDRQFDESKVSEFLE